ncbi:MAG: hypothetical protein K6357_01775 [Elusimicrobiota bacterium]
MFYIYSSKINTGKTTKLFDLEKKIINRYNVCSFLSVKRFKNNKRIYDLYFNGKKINKIVEVENKKIYYYQKVFDFAFYIIKKYNFEFYIIDEAGLLELSKKGFYKTIKYLIKKDKKSIFVVRDFLVESFIEFFKIKNYKVINSLNNICLK